MKRSVPVNSASLTFKAFASSLKTSMRLFMSKKKKGHLLTFVPIWIVYGKALSIQVLP